MPLCESMTSYTKPKHNRFMALWTLSGTTHLSRYQKKHSPTHTCRSHQSSLICFLHLLLSVFNLRALESLSTISSSFLWSTSWPGNLHFILHTFLHPIIIFFLQHMPITSQPFAVVPRLCHLIPVICCHCSFTSRNFHSTSATLSLTMLW